MKNWNEIKTASHVARLGTVSAAAETLGLHRATVIRHIDALEKLLGKKIFLRHARGYTPTDVGLDLMNVAKTAEQEFEKLVGRTNLQSTELSGSLIVTSMEVLAADLMPSILAYQAQHPKIRVQFIATERVFALEYGEAHIAIRLGSKPSEPDNIARQLYQHTAGLYASSSYIERHGKPQKTSDLRSHFFVARDIGDPKAPFEKWLNSHVPPENFIFQSRNFLVMHRAILSGIGIGFYPKNIARQSPDLIEIFPGEKNWRSTVWAVTHVDQHRSQKVQAFLKVLKKQFNVD